MCPGLATVLIIDDDKDSRDAVAQYLAKAGHAVRCASSGQECVAALGDGAPDAVILDVRMPGMDGIAVLGVMRSYLKWATVPVAIFTAYPDDPRLWHVDLSGVTRIFGKAKTDLSDVLEWVERQSAIPGRGGGDVEGCWGGQGLA